MWLPGQGQRREIKVRDERKDRSSGKVMRSRGRGARRIEGGLERG